MEKRAWAKGFEIEGLRFEGTRREDGGHWNAVSSKSAHRPLGVLVRGG
ncbi:MAG: hypothetical protein LLG16_00200 [Euryarchaeota archaeon]|nr:hypothetical protein [Euryarchaeota archaeon]